MPRLTLRRLVGYTFPLYNTVTVQRSPCVHWAHSTLLHYLKPSQPGWATNRVHDAERRLAAILVALSFLLPRTSPTPFSVTS
jgi:hypothetical protein